MKSPYLRNEPNDTENIVIKTRQTVNIGRYQLYLYPAEIKDGEKMYHQLIITLFDSSDKEVNHKMFYLKENTEVVLPKATLEAAVEDLFNLPEFTKLEPITRRN